MENIESKADPADYVFAQASPHRAVGDQKVEMMGVHLSTKPYRKSGANNMFLPLPEAAKLLIGLRNALQVALDSADTATFEEVKGLMLNEQAQRRAAGKPDGAELLFRRPKEFKVVMVSKTRNSFGLTGLIIMARDGMAYEVGVSDLHLKEKGQVVRLEVSGNDVVPNPGFFFEIPRRLTPDANPAVVREVWGR